MVKTNLEGDSEKNPVPSIFRHEAKNSGISFRQSNLPLYPSGQYPSSLSPPQETSLTIDPVSDFSCPDEDIDMVFDVFLGNKKRNNVVLVGDSLSKAEGVAAEVIVKFQKGDVPNELKSVKLITLRFSTVRSIGLMKKHEVDTDLGDLKRKVDSFGLNGRVIVYVGDLKWAVDRDGGGGGGGEKKEEFTAVDYLITEIGKLVSGYNCMSSSMRVWVMATADYETYMKQTCVVDVQWGLHAVFVPSGGLGLSLNATSGWDSISYISNHEKENGSAKLPCWLKPHGNDTLDKEDLVQLRRKYNLCQNLHQGSQNLHYSTFVTSNPCNLGKIDTIGGTEKIPSTNPSFGPNYQNSSSLPRFRPQPQSCHLELGFSNASSKYQSLEPDLDSLKRTNGKKVKTTLSLGNSIDHDKMAVDIGNIIQEKVPWQCESIPMILEALMDYSKAIDEDNKFLLLQGNDSVGIRRLAVGIAKSMFGSSDLLFRMNMQNNARYTTEGKNHEILEMVLKNHEKMVVLVEDLDYADLEFVKYLLENKGYSCRTIFILTMDSDTRCNNIMMDIMNSVLLMKLLVFQESKQDPRMSSFDHKRKLDWDLPIKSKNRKMYNEIYEVFSNYRELSSNALDLNKEADGGDENGNLSPISSDVTREVTDEHPNLLLFLKRNNNRFIFNRNADKDEKAREMLLKFQRSFHEATNYISCFDVEENLLEEVLRGSGFYLNDLFEEWLRDIFRTSLRMVGVGDHWEKVSVRLCLDGKLGESCGKDGFMGTCLPTRIPVYYM
ncbi:hypothetical protein OROHE_021995 [Orobanche hederae]